MIMNSTIEMSMNHYLSGSLVKTKPLVFCGRVVHCVPSKTISFEFRSECQNSIFFFSFFLWIMKWNFESEENLMRHEIAFWRKKMAFSKMEIKDCKTVSPPSCKIFAWQKKIPRRVLASVCLVRCRSFKWNILSLQLTGFRIWRVLWWSWFDKIMLPCTYIWNIFGLLLFLNLRCSMVFLY